MKGPQFSIAKRPAALVIKLLLLLLSTLPLNTYAQQIIQLTDQQQVYQLGPSLEILEDSTNTLGIEQVSSADFRQQFTASTTLVPSFGYSKSSFWVKFTVHNNSSNTRDWILGQFNANTHYIDLYSTKSSNSDFSVKQSGNLRPFSKRDIPNRLILFKLQLEPEQQQTYYININNGSSMTIDLKLLSWQGMIYQNQLDNYWHGIIIGILLIMMIYNLFLYYSLKDSSYIWLIAFIASAFISASFYDGFSQILFSDSWAKYSYLGASLSGNLLVISLLKFNNRFLSTTAATPNIIFIEKSLVSLFALLTLLALFISYGTWITLVIPPMVITIVFILYRVTHSLLTQATSSKLFASGWYVLLSTLVIFLLNRLAWIPSNFITENIFAIGVIWLVLFMSLAQADKINQLRRKTQQALNALQKSEEELLVSNTKYQSLFESANDAIFLIKDDVFCECNLKTLELFDCQLDDILGKNPIQFSPEKQAKGIASKDLARTKTEAALAGEVQFFEWRFITKNGTQFDAEVSLKRIHLGNDTYLLALVRCITEKKLIEEQLNRSQKMEAMGKLTGGIAHDYNNMLGVILGFAEILDAQLHDHPKLQEYAQRILQAGKRSQKLTSKLLAFSRRKDSENQQVDLNSLLQDNQHILAKSLTAKIQLILDLSPETWPAWVDKNDFEDALFNIAINAMHAMPDGGQFIMKTRNIQLTQQQANQLGIIARDYIHLSITDTGIGMDNETLSNIFDPFFTTKGDAGTGLGMSQVYGFVTRSGSGIRVDSELGKGTTIHLYIPRFTGKPKSEHIHNHIPSETATGNETILVVDDEPAICYLSEEILSSQGYHVIIAESAESALDKLTNHNVDLIISDVIMPGMNGFQLAREVRKLYPQIKFQIASGYSENMASMNDDQEQSLIDDMLHKPFDKETLLEKIRKHLGDSAG